MKKINFVLLIIVSLSFLGLSCSKNEDKPKFNLFSVNDDMEFGKQFDAEIMSSSSEFVILNETTYKDAYNYINDYKTKLLNTGKVDYAKTFSWKVRIIHNDTTINAFAVPGGYLYFYTGLIKALDNESEFTGVMAHEMAHVARRHSTAQLTKAYGIELLLGMLLGNSNNQWVTIAANMASGLASLQFSRTDEFEADKYSVIYNNETEWDARGVAEFFRKMDAQPFFPVFLSTHPADKDRIERVNNEWKALGEKVGNTNEASYSQFVSKLP